MCKKPKYDDLLETYINGNRKDFAFKVKLYGLGNFIGVVETDPEIMRIGHKAAMKMIGCAVRLGGYE